MSGDPAKLRLFSAPPGASGNVPLVTAPGARADSAPGANPIDPRRRVVFIPSKTAPIEPLKPAIDYSLAAGPVGSFAWAKARMDERFPLGNDMTEAQRAFFAERVADDSLKAKQQLSPAPHLEADNGVELGMDEKGRVYRLDDSVTCWPVDESPEIDRIRAANEVFNLVCERETGLLVDPARKEKKEREEKRLLAQTHRIAKKLESGGVAAYLASEWTIATYGVHSGERKTLPKFRRKTFLPFVAAKLREPRIRDLEFWLQHDDWARFWTLTGGKRVRLRDLRKAIKRLHRRIRHLNDADFMKEAGVRIVFRSTELGTIETKRQLRKTKDGESYMALLDDSGAESGNIERDANGELWFHPHAHCLVHLEKGRLEPTAWSEFLVKLRAHWGDWMDDDGIVRNVREAVKYVTKPGEVEHLSAEELVALDAQLSRLHLVQPLGDLAAQIQERESAGLTLWPETTKDGRIWRVDLDPNKRGKSSKEKVRVKFAERPESGERFVGTFTEVQFEKEHARQHASDVDGCAVVARVSPGAASNYVKEPRVVVMFKRWDEKRVATHPLVSRLREYTRDAWLAGCALAAAAPAEDADPIRVHTGTLTVADPAHAAPPGRTPRPRDPQFAAHIARLDALAAPTSR